MMMMMMMKEITEGGGGCLPFHKMIFLESNDISLTSKQFYG